MRTAAVPEKSAAQSARSAGLAVIAATCTLPALLLVATGVPAQQTFPAKSMRLVVGVTPGGAADFTARVLSQQVQDALGQSMLVDNRPGAGGTLASETVARSAPDGYTLLLSSSSTHGVAPALYSKLPWDALKDFTHVALVNTIPGVMALHQAVPAKTVKEFVALAQAKPGGYLFASSGNGSAPHVMAELFKLRTKTELGHVPYKGSGPAVVDLGAGAVQAMFDGLPSLLPQIKLGRIRAIAAMSGQRSTVMPEIPTMAESGYPGIEGGLWYGVSGPAKIDPAVVEVLAREVMRAAASAETRERFTSVGAFSTPLGPKEYTAFIARELAKWGEVIRASGARID
ncbi:MAG: tripartite tricarboxylate transporter substrate binding protein [Rhodocyclaceae bacterium]|nr:tripartite tricarboxylate transporter substrate binding protein [Rhodocyclaceae bacterium]MCA3074767.1 tripartite tricarboxylate transporter substrate binding protein [Rhodocyclaceae bacterium]MCA3091607.1 tripartite tricarboxylate transporter substrate binding protein [Rhodocyclaceae bacterium]MCA3093959.1 tripartite tricarboxylate transporter substrate binding protein [Rhodocyclaceae bacterium]MCA3099080.1 tripartite tricarboxylate transporter substrate binding protein [Rhodocyclaceae bact